MSHRVLRGSPGSFPGPFFGLILWLVLMLPALPAEPVRAQEILSWWRRDLLPLDLEPGHWVRYESIELAEGRSYADTLRFTVRERKPEGTIWLEIEPESSAERSLLLLDPQRIREGAELLDALLRLVRIGSDGRLIEEPVEEHRESRVVQRHFQDVFTDPTLERNELPDTVLAGVPSPRERLVLHEVKEERTPMGSHVLVLRSELRSEIVLSSKVPLFGVLWARNRTEVSSRTAREGGGTDRGRRAPPLFNQLTLRCLDFGTDARTGVPSPLRH